MEYTAIETLPGNPEETLKKSFTGTFEDCKEWALRTIYFFKGVISIYDGEGNKVY